MNDELHTRVEAAVEIAWVDGELYALICDLAAALRAAETDLATARTALQACWDEYHELMPDALYEQVKAALNIREFVASTPTTTEDL